MQGSLGDSQAASMKGDALIQLETGRAGAKQNLFVTREKKNQCPTGHTMAYKRAIY